MGAALSIPTIRPASKVVPFPRSRHQPFVARIADEMLCMGAVDAERYLGQQIRIQRSTMARRGIADDRAAQELRALETAVRARLWRLVLTPDGAA